MHRVAVEVMRLNTQLAQAVQETSATFQLDDLNKLFQALLSQLEEHGICRWDVHTPPILSKEQWFL